ncbi:MAG: 16S rRNA (uracil(1498)-N(3))-methyltransferase [Microthrixaceae bacterium]|nr:16S rRNA (uracil(1498)-N(3))-methyltransferase [Microthrixaceae bacterium]
MTAESHEDRSGDETPWRRARAQALVEDLANPTLDDDVEHHLRRVLRLEKGAAVCAYDGAGSWSLGTLGDGPELEDPSPPQFTSAPSARLTVGFAALKGSRTELVVQKLTELGVDRIWILRTRRGVVRWDADRSERQVARLGRVASESCAQCRRLRIPDVQVMSFADAVAAGAVLADAGGRPLRREDRTVLVGPEGGWDDEERMAAESVVLGENVLRAETAAIVAGSSMAQLRLGLR